VKSLVVAPHPDDKTLGCGGTLLRRKAEGGTIGWLLMTELNKKWGWSDQRISKKQIKLIKCVNSLVSAKNIYTNWVSQQPV